MFDPKPISKDSIPRALSKAERYRLLNEPFQAESICRDILAADPANQDATVCLVLALTDMFETGDAKVDDARTLAATLAGAYERLYYEGVVQERWASALLVGGYPASSVYDLFCSAMQRFEDARALAPGANDDAVLRWNACVRMMARHGLTPEDESEIGDTCSLDDDVPMR